MTQKEAPKLGEYRNLAKQISNQWKLNGGWSGFFQSPVVHLAMIFSITCQTSSSLLNWPDMSISIIPSLLGFSLGTYALLFSLITPQLKDALKNVKQENEENYLSVLNAMFFIAIFYQIISLAWALIYKHDGLLLNLKINLNGEAYEWIALAFGHGGALFGWFLLSLAVLSMITTLINVSRIGIIG